MTAAIEYQVRLRSLQGHPKQAAFVASPAKRRIARAGRRGGKTVGAAQIALKWFLAGRRVLYATPTQDQLDAFWWEVKRALGDVIDAGVYYKNETMHFIEVPGTKNRIRAKTAWNADTLRGDYADGLILDEFHLIDETAWSEVGAPMLMDNNGDAVFIYTPPSMRSRSVTKARDPLHAPKLFKHANGDHRSCQHPASEQDEGRWSAHHWTSKDNPHVTEEALAETRRDMTELAWRQEIEAEDIENVPGALWKPEMIIYGEPPHAINANGKDIGRDLISVAVSVDPSGGGPRSDEVGIVVSARGVDDRGYVLADRSIQGVLTDVWAQLAIGAYYEFNGHRLIAEVNYGGDMVRDVIQTRAPGLPVDVVHATHGKQVRAEPVAALYEQGRVSHVQQFPELEQQLCQWVPGPGSKSPGRLDALVWAMTELMVTGGSPNVRWL